MRWTKTYRELKKSGYRHPLIARFFNSSFVYLAFGLSAVLVLSLFFVESKESYQRILEPREVSSPYLEVDPSGTPANEWAEAFVEIEPPNINDWEREERTSPRQPYTFKECNALGLLPASQYAAYSATGDQGDLIVQVYAPGQAMKHFKEYEELLGSCWSSHTETEGNPPTSVLYHDHGFAFTYGDAIFFFKTKDITLRDTLAPWYVSKAARTLEAAACLDLTVTVEDATRNLYVDKDSYTGLLVHDSVVTTVSVTELPTPILQPVDDVPSAVEPEGPLPENFPRQPDAPFEKPEHPDSPEKPPADNFRTTVTYQAPDDRGPGCGWAWGSTQTPVLDRNQLVELKSLAYTTAQVTADTEAQNFVKSRLKEARDSISLSLMIENWNLYVDRVENVHERWAWLEAERAKLFTPWLRYVEAHDQWMNFDNRKANAQKKFDEEVAECVALDKELEEWEKEYGSRAEEEEEESQDRTSTSQETSSDADSTETASFQSAVFLPASPTQPSPTPPAPRPSPDPTEPTEPEPTEPEPTEPEPTEPEPEPEPIPPRPSGCTDVPEEPEILSESKGSEPQPPRIPEGVTIPESWKDPITSPTVKLN